MGRNAEIGEECGTLSLGDRPGQLRGWNVPEKYVAYSWRTGNKALSLALSPPLLPSSLLHPEFSCLSFYPSLLLTHSLSMSMCISSTSPLLLAFGYFFFLSIFLQFKLIPFFPLSCLGNSHSMVVLHQLRLVAAECSPACHLGSEIEKKENNLFLCYVAH